jgi:hypothetical protein
MINAVSVVSDFAYNATTGIYEPLDPALNELSNVEYSDYIDLNATIPSAITLTSALPGNPTVTADVTVLNSIGIEFFQKVGANYYQLNTGNSLKIQNVF